MHDHEALSPWKRFWERGGWWKALILAAVYYVLYQLAGFPVVAIFPAGGAVRGDAGSAMDVFTSIGLPIIIAAALLLIFAASLGWLKELFGPQPIRGTWWMWIAVAVVLITNILKLVSIDYATGGLPWAASWMLTGLAIGFAEELLTRGFVVNLMRKAGHKEVAVALVSSAVFAALHIGNIFQPGQSPLSIALLVGYTFFFGFCMYLALRVTGNLIWPMLLHASTDPATFMFTIHPGASPVAAIAGFGNIPVIFTGLVLLVIFIITHRHDRVKALN